MIKEERGGNETRQYKTRGRARGVEGRREDMISSGRRGGGGVGDVQG